jgi:hypothetical protein
MLKPLGIDGYWVGVHDADPRAVPIYRRHYSANPKANNWCGFSGNGQTMVLLTLDCKALWNWRFVKEEGVVCSVFRNEGPILSSKLILEAEELAWRRWPGQRLFTYCWDAKVASVNPGYCFKKAGWRVCGRNKDGRLTILEKLPMV